MICNNHVVLLIPCFIVALTYVWIHWKLSVFGDIVLLSCYRLWLAWIFCSAEPDARHPPWISHTLLPENVRLPTAKITRYLILETLKDSGLNNLTITTCNILKPAINIPSIYLFYTWEFLFSRYEILVVQLHRSWVSVGRDEPMKVSPPLTVALSCLWNFWGWNPTKVCREYFINQYKDPY